MWGAGCSAGALLILNVPDRAAQFSLGVLKLGVGIYSIFNRKLGLEHSPRHRDRPGYLVGGIVLFLLGLFWIASGALTLGVMADIYWEWLPALVLGSLLDGYLGAHFGIIKWQLQDQTRL